jgi:ribose/xylose/arabinose/galactoside ABC-type transport system permease subunit
MRRLLRDPHTFPLALLLVVIAGFAVLDWGQGRFLSAATVFSTFETFATIGFVALGLGITMIMREFDLSLAGMVGMAGCVAVMTGGLYPALGIVAAVLVGIGCGGAQGLLIARLRLASVGVTLGGLLIFIGVAYVLTQSTSIPYDNLDVAMAMGDHYFGMFSIRSLSAIGLYVVVGGVIGFTRIGRDVIATGSDRAAAFVSGVNVGGLIVAAFAFSGGCAAFSGALLSYSLALAAPGGLSDVLVPAVTAAIIGGVSLSGGNGRPLGIACGVLVLSVLRSGFNAIGAEPWISEVATAVILLVVAALDAPQLMRRWRRATTATEPLGPAA